MGNNSLGFSKLGSKLTVRIPEGVKERLALEVDNVVIFLPGSKEDEVIMKKGKVVANE